MAQHSILNPRDYFLLAFSARKIDWLCDLCLQAGTLALLIFTPLAFGSVHVWAYSLMEMGIFFLAMVWMAQTLLGHSDTVTQRRNDGHCVAHSLFRQVIGPALPLVLFVGLILFQLTPLPPGLLRILSPSTYRLYQTALPGWPHQEPFADLVEITVQRLAPTSGLQAEPRAADIPLTPDASHLTPHVSSWRSLSVYPQAGWVELLKVLAYLAFFSLVALRNSPLLLGERTWLKGTSSLLLVLLTTGTGLALLAFLQQATWNGKLLWFFVPYHWSGPQPGSEGKLHGPFVNPDHFASYLEMILPLAMAAMLVSGRRLWERAGVRGKGVRLSTQITQTVAALSSLRAICCGLCTLAVIVILTALVFTLSRGGFSAAFAALFFMAWLLWPQSREVGKRESGRAGERWGQLWTKLGRAVCLLGFLSVPVIYLEYPEVFGRFLQTPQEMDTGRPVVYTATLALWRDFPFLGVGLGNFREVFPRYQPPAAGQVFYDYTHNDSLQLLAETGLIGFLLLVWGVFAVLRRAARSWPRVTGEHRLWLAGIFAGIVALLLHSLVDFPLHIPSNALLFVTLLALAARIGQEQIFSIR